MPKERIVLTVASNRGMERLRTKGHEVSDCIPFSADCGHVGWLSPEFILMLNDPDLNVRTRCGDCADLESGGDHSQEFITPDTFERAVAEFGNEDLVRMKLRALGIRIREPISGRISMP